LIIESRALVEPSVFKNLREIFLGEEVRKLSDDIGRVTEKSSHVFILQDRVKREKMDDCIIISQATQNSLEHVSIQNHQIK
jgi:hypothetical protein